MRWPRAANGKDWKISFDGDSRDLGEVRLGQWKRVEAHNSLYLPLRKVIDARTSDAQVLQTKLDLEKCTAKVPQARLKGMPWDACPACDRYWSAIGRPHFDGF